jgi:tRNA U34 5-methylaminomethyl-2-thiouridine-forming methyltransferase MnmC
MYYFSVALHELNSPFMQQQIKITNDGSHTLYVPELSEHYHSINGALSESKHVFIKNGLLAANLRSLTVLEVGFGTGLNAMLTLGEALKHKIKVNYYTLEKYPLGKEIIDQLNYPSINEIDSEIFKNLHNANWNQAERLNDYFTITKYDADLQEFNTNIKFDVIYFDAFAPDKQPEMWRIEVFEKMFSFMNKGAKLSTYCAKGEIRRRLENTGFIVERLPGPPGKREMLRAQKPY